MSEQSDSIKELASALAKAQGKITGALKDSANPFFKSKYADLASVWDACREALSANGIAVIQFPESDDSGLYIVTTLTHSSGEWMRSRLRMTPKDDTPQAAGSAITYGRRYALAAAVGVAQIDDDGNAASGKKEGNDPRGEQPPVDEKEVSSYVDRFNAAFSKDVEEEEKATEVFKIHSEVCTKEALYIAIGDRLGNKGRTAIRAYVQMVAKRKQPLANGRAAA